MNHPISDSRAVVITGCSSGIGRATALLLDAHGWRVFAVVRRIEDADTLRALASPRLYPLLADVRDAASLRAAAESVARELGAQRGLCGLVNNAAVILSGPLEHLDLDRLRDQYEVNVFGVLAATQAFLPLLRRGWGRIVNIGATRVTMPFFGPIASTKSALRTLNDALRLELHPRGMRVCLIEPALVASGGSAKLRAVSRETIAALPPEARRHYGPVFERFVGEIARRNDRGTSLEAVARVVLRALVCRLPRAHYRVGAMARALPLADALLPSFVFDRIRLLVAGLPVRFGRWK